MTKELLTSAVGLLIAGATLALVAPERPTAATGDLVADATINRPAHGGAKSHLEWPDERTFVDPQETIGLELKLNAGTGKLRLEAPNGGAINSAGGVAFVEPPSAGQPLRVDFTPGTHRGRYTLELSQGNRKHIMRFWVGAPPPLGRPGPDLTFTPAK